MKKYLFLLIVFASCKKEEIKVTQQKTTQDTSKVYDVVLRFESGCGGYEVYFDDKDNNQKHTINSTSGIWEYSFQAKKGYCIYFFSTEYSCLTPNYYKHKWSVQIDGVQTKQMYKSGSGYLRDTIK